MTQSPDEKTYVEFPFIEQLKGMWTLVLIKISIPFLTLPEYTSCPTIILCGALAT